MNGYSEDGFEEWAEAQRGKYPPWVDIIMMEDDLGIPNLELNAIEEDRGKAWEYYYELKAKLDQQQRKTA